MLYDSALVLAQPGAADDVASAATAAVGASLAPGGNQIECRTAASAAALVLRHGLMLPQPGPTAHALASAFTRWQMLDDNNRPLPDAVAVRVVVVRFIMQVCLFIKMHRLYIFPCITLLEIMSSLYISNNSRCSSDMHVFMSDDAIFNAKETGEPSSSMFCDFNSHLSDHF